MHQSGAIRHLNKRKAAETGNGRREALRSKESQKKDRQGIPGMATKVSARQSSDLTLGRALGLSLMLLGLLAWPLARAVAAQEKPDDTIPDAPSATRPIPPPPPASPRPGAPGADDETQPDTQPANTPSGTPNFGLGDVPRSASDQNPPPPPAMPPIKTIPAGSVPKDVDSGEDVGYTIRSNPTLVLVPVTIKDNEGRLVGGLQPKDFMVLENGQPQKLTFFTSDPFALSAAVIIDTGLPDVGLKKVQATLTALQGAFSQFDEVSIYTYSSTVSQVSDFSGAGRELTAVLNEVKGYSGANNGPPVTSGPLGPQGPMINGLPIDTPTTPVSTPPKVAYVLNDAILMAARDLSKRDRTHRKIIFVISDGREQGSTAGYKDTLKVLLTQNITVYAVGVEGAAIPLYDRLQRIHLPKTNALMGYSDILPKYVNATGGGTVYGELTQADIEKAYAAAMGDARYQYTLGYSPKSSIGGYRDIVVEVRRHDVKVFAKAGYYPLPAPR
jgi:VWFA-related protein